MRYEESVIEQVRSANDIVEIIGRRVRLTKKGSGYFGLCPFHGEKTGSFFVSPRRQTYHCFGCGVGGNVISFLMEYENYTFPEALKALADNAHIELPANASGEGEDRRAKELRARLLEINKEAALYYHKMLRSPEGRVGYDYLAGRRRLSNAMITHFGLGYSQKMPDTLYRYLRDKGYTDELLAKSGLVTITEKGARDKFWNRVMFPIMDTNNRVIGFGGRVMGEGEPKYLNSPETMIFDKSATLYGLNFAKRSRQKYLLLCEGYMDVIALHQAGFTNAVASLGTAMTEKHARLLKRYTDEVILTQDSDAAGIRAKVRAYPLLHDAGISVKILDMGKYKDPDELLQAEGAEGYERCIREAKNAFLYVISVLREEFNLADPAEKTGFIRETADRLCMFTDPIERGNYVDAVSREFMIDREELKSLVDRMAENGSRGSLMRDIEMSRRYEQRRRERDDGAVWKSTVSGRSRGQESAGSPDNHAGRKEPDPEGNAGRQGPAADGNSGRSLAEEFRTESQEMLLAAWISEMPGLAAAVFLKAGEFRSRVCGLIVEAAAGGNSGGRMQGAFDPASFLDRDDLDEEERRYAAAVFARLDLPGQSPVGKERADLEKGLTEAVRTILAERIDQQMERCGSDFKRFGELLKERKRLAELKITLEESASQPAQQEEAGTQQERSL